MRWLARERKGYSTKHYWEGPSREVTLEWTPTCTKHSRGNQLVTSGKITHHRGTKHKGWQVQEQPTAGDVGVQEKGWRGRHIIQGHEKNFYPKFVMGSSGKNISKSLRKISLCLLVSGFVLEISSESCRFKTNLASLRWSDGLIWSAHVVVYTDWILNVESTPLPSPWLTICFIY